MSHALHRSERLFLRALAASSQGISHLTPLRKALRPMNAGTFNRNLEKLVRRGFITCSPGTVHITPAGREAAADLRALVEAIR